MNEVVLPVLFRRFCLIDYKANVLHWKLEAGAREVHDSDPVNDPVRNDGQSLQVFFKILSWPTQAWYTNMKAVGSVQIPREYPSLMSGTCMWA